MQQPVGRALNLSQSRLVNFGPDGGLPNHFAKYVHLHYMEHRIPYPRAPQNQKSPAAPSAPRAFSTQLSLRYPETTGTPRRLRRRVHFLQWGFRWMSSPLTISKAISPRSKAWIPGGIWVPQGPTTCSGLATNFPQQIPHVGILKPCLWVGQAAEGGRDVLHHFFFAGAAFFALDAFGAAAFFAIAERGGEREAGRRSKVAAGPRPPFLPSRGGGITARRRADFEIRELALQYFASPTPRSGRWACNLLPPRLRDPREIPVG